jgi:single-stranded DNA-binding protein
MAKRNTTKAPEAEATPEKEPFLSHNRVSLAGRLVADPELRYTPTGKAVLHISIQVVEPVQPLGCGDERGPTLAHR